MTGWPRWLPVCVKAPRLSSLRQQRFVGHSLRSKYGCRGKGRGWVGGGILPTQTHRPQAVPRATPPLIAQDSGGAPWTLGRWQDWDREKGGLHRAPLTRPGNGADLCPHSTGQNSSIWSHLLCRGGEGHLASWQTGRDDEYRRATRQSLPLRPFSWIGRWW